MKRILWLTIGLLSLNGCASNVLSYNSGDLEVQVNAGKHWLHDYPLLLGLTKKNPPQFAIWLTDLDTNYLETIFVTQKIANENWVSNDGNRRKEALPFWSHNRGIIYKDGLFLPTKDKPLTDGLTGATPKKSSEYKYQPNLKRFLIFAEFNHSVDFNDFYPQNAQVGAESFSGG